MADTTFYGPNPIENSGKGGHSNEGSPKGSKGPEGQEGELRTKEARSQEHRTENGTGIPVATKPN